MTPHEQLVRATDIAIRAHAGQYDRNGQPYLGHVIRVMAAGHTMNEKITGVLHDLVEDTPWTLEKLSREGFPHEIVDAVDAMTARETESYEEYLLRLAKNPIAVRVKLHDLTDNMDVRRLHSLADENIARMRKYLKAYRLLTQQ